MILFGKKFPDLSVDPVHQTCPRFHTGPCNMGRDEKPGAVGEVSQGMIRPHGLRIQHIQPRRGDLPLFQCFSQILFHNDRPPTHVDQDRRVLHPAKSLPIHQVSRLLCQRRVNGNHVRSGQKRVKIHFPVVSAVIFPAGGIVLHFTAESLGNAGHPLADGSQTDNAPLLAGQFPKYLREMGKGLIPDARVTAVDLSPQALAVARRNAVRLGAEVRFVQADALAGLHELPDAAFDLIVSNPPYVPQSDRAAMHVNVRDYEPPEALFVPDDDPLRFYRAIGRAARRLLRPDGRLWFEIYEQLADETARLLANEGFGDIAVRRDINDKPRILCCTARK